MKITQELLDKSFKHYNDYIFGGELPKAKIKVYSSKINQGFFEGYYDENGEKFYLIKISDRYNKTYIDFCQTLIHEMVHCYQFLHNLPVDHGKEFIRICKRINKLMGMDII